MNDKKYEITASLEDYLERIYWISMKNETVRVTDIAVMMDISKPSVNRAINTLKNQGLVYHEHYGTLSLTEEGVRLAKNIVNRHTILKRFLRDLLGVDEETAEDEACRIEHTVSPSTIEKLSHFVEKTLNQNN